MRGALGATASQLAGAILRQGLRKTTVGIIAGLIGAFLLSRLITSLLSDVQLLDPIAYLVAPLLVLGVAALASYLPARRAARIDPVQALRVE